MDDAEEDAPLVAADRVLIALLFGVGARLAVTVKDASGAPLETCATNVAPRTAMSTCLALGVLLQFCMLRIVGQLASRNGLCSFE